MYVIFPADELIYMTYGATVPRVKPRPTLDNLREPLVPIGTRPHPNSNARNEYPAAPSPVYPTQLLSTTPIDDPTTYPASVNDNNNNNDNQSNSSRSKRRSKSTETDIFGYKPSRVDKVQETHSRSPSKIPEIVLTNHVSTTPTKVTSQTGTAVANTGDKGKSGKKHKLHLHIGPLGRSKQNQKPEPARLRDVTDIHIANPAFTRENLQKRNYDAFFESGVPVYSLAQRAPQQPSPEPEPPPALAPNSAPPTSVKIASATDNRPHSLGFFHKSKPTVAFRSKSAEVVDSVEVPQKEHQKPAQRSIFGWRGAHSGPLNPSDSMASSSIGILKDCTHQNYTETFKLHNNVTFKLVKTVSDFTDQLSQLYDQHAEALQLLVSTYRKRNGELRKERPACHSTLFQAWETFLQEIEADSVSSSDVASTLSRQVSRPLLEKTFHKKVHSRKIFTHRESFDTIIAKTEEKLSKCRLEYKQCYIAHRQNPNQHTLTMYIDSHNAYVQQLHATNAMMETYHCDTIPQLMQELEDIYVDLCSIVSDGVLQGADIIASKANEQSKRYECLSNQCRVVSGQQDLHSFVKFLQPEIPPKVPRKAYAPPYPAGETDDTLEYSDQQPIPLKNELIMERNASLQMRPSIDALRREAVEIEMQIRQLQDTVESLVRNQLRGIESQLYSKANELQEDISMKKFDLRAKQIHLAAVKAQKELFLGKSDPGSPRTERKLSVASSSSMKTKWLKAFRSLKPASGLPPNDKRNGPSAVTGKLFENEHHNLLEYTYKKITPCDVCSQVLRGHTRQGLRCRICKMNVHVDCAAQLPKCQVKQKLLRRQKSTSEIENRVDLEEERDGSFLLSRQLTPIDNYKLEPTDIDRIYQVLKQAGEISSKTNESKTGSGGGVGGGGGGSSSGGRGGGGGGGGDIASSVNNGNATQQDIPILNVPECPERTQRREQVKPPSHSAQANSLAAPKTDLSSSDGSVSMQTTGPIVHGTANFVDTGTRRRLFAGFRPLSTFARTRIRSNQHRSISLPETPHSPRRQKLNLRMKSLSLDSPESTELHGNMRRRYPPQQPGPSHYPSAAATGGAGGSGGAIEHTPPSNNSRLHSPSSPSQQRNLLSANRNIRTGSVDLPDDMEKSLSSASTSPCISPVRQNQKSHRLLPTNLYVILYNFKARHPDELDLKAGYKVTVIDTSDPDWWKGKCLGRIGYFPSKYCARLTAGEKPLQVIQNLQLSDGDRSDGIMTLLRDQIVVQVGEEISGAVMVRSADNRQGVCPVKYLQEV